MVLKSNLGDGDMEDASPSTDGLSCECLTDQGSAERTKPIYGTNEDGETVVVGTEPDGVFCLRCGLRKGDAAPAPEVLTTEDASALVPNEDAGE